MHIDGRLDSTGVGSGYQYLNGSASTQDAILVDQSWLNALTPTTPLSGPGRLDWNSTTIESILNSVRITEDIQHNGKTFIDDWQNQNNTNRSGLLCSVIASFIVDGLSRTGVTRMFRAQGNPSKWTLSPYEKENDIDRLILKGKRALNHPEANHMFNVNFGISGLSYQTSTAQQLAMVVLLLHMVIASIHIVWTITRGKSSASWDSVTEIMVLAQNSKPAMKALQNTAAGIQRSATFSENVVIRTTKLHDIQEPDHLELLLTEEAADAGGEMVDLPPQNPGLSQSGQSSVAHADQQHSETANLIPLSIWPQNPGSSQSRQNSVAQADQQHSETTNMLSPPMLPQNTESSQSEQGSIAQVGQQHSETSTLIPPNTLPQNPGRPQSGQSSVALADQQHSERANLEPPPTLSTRRPPRRLERTLLSLVSWSRKSTSVRNPRAAPSSPDSRTASEIHSREDHAYR